MCKYAIFNEGKMPICEYTNTPCTLCVLGNGNTYKEAEERLNSDKLSEVIRLMYVGMTRAKHTLRLSFADLGKTWHTNPSKYISGFNRQTPIPDELENKINSLYRLFIFLYFLY